MYLYLIASGFGGHKYHLQNLVKADSSGITMLRQWPGSVFVSECLALLFLAASFSSLSNDRISIRFIHTEVQPDRQETILLLLNAFEKLHDNTDVEVILAEENQIDNDLEILARSGNLPDLIYASSHVISGLAQKNLLDTKSTGTALMDIGQHRFYPGTLQVLANSKGFFAIPYNNWVQGIWYRKDWFDQAGLAAPDTWNNILTAARHFYKPELNQYGVLIGTMADNYAEQVFTQLAISNKAYIFDTKGNLVFNSPEMGETLDFYKELAKFTPPGEQTWRARDYYIQGKLAMFFYSTFIMDDLALSEAAQSSLSNRYFPELGETAFDPELVDKTDAVMVINQRRPSSYGSMNALALSKSDNKNRSEAAGKLLRYLYNPSTYILFLHMAPGGMNSVFEDIVRDPHYLDDPLYLFQRYGQQKIIDITESQEKIQTFSMLDGTPHPEADETFNRQIIPRMINKVIVENLSTQEALDWAEERIKTVVENFRSQSSSEQE